VSFAQSPLLTEHLKGLSALQDLFPPDAVASIAPQPAVRDDRDPPLVTGRGVSCMPQIRISVNKNILPRGLDGGALPDGQVGRFGILGTLWSGPLGKP
jgi:hypothetical protein